jgi:hypothetical protein
MGRQIQSYITDENIKKSEQVLIDNGIEADEASIVLQAIGYTLLDEELYPEKKEEKKPTGPIYLYTRDGKHKVDITKAKLLADVGRELKIDRQGDYTQLWISNSGQYFRGSCLDFKCESSIITLMTPDETRAWIIKYYGGKALINRFHFDDAECI